MLLLRGRPKINQSMNLTSLRLSFPWIELSYKYVDTATIWTVKYAYVCDYWLATFIPGPIVQNTTSFCEPQCQNENSQTHNFKICTNVNSSNNKVKKICQNLDWQLAAYIIHPIPTSILTLVNKQILEPVKWQTEKE